MSRMILSAFSDEYAVSFEDQLEGMAELGIGHIELRHVNGKNVSELSKSEGREVKRMLEHFGIRVSAIGSPIGKICLSGDMTGHLDRAKRIFELAELLSAPFVRVFSFYAPEGKDIPITLAHENEALIYGDTPERCRELLDCFDGELRCVFDMGNFVLENVRPYPFAYEILKDGIAYFHIKDALFEGAIVPSGKGDAGIKEILDAHASYANEDFFVSLEPHLQTFSGLNLLVGRSFENPYKYEDEKSAFCDAVKKFRELMKI